MLRMTRQLFGKRVRLELTSEDKAEVIQWRDYFFNWGAIKIEDGNNLDLSGSLDRQTPQEITPGEFNLSFSVMKDRLIKAFEDSAEANTDWETITKRGGKRARQKMHKELHSKALQRFEAIPASY